MWGNKDIEGAEDLLSETIENNTLKETEYQFQ
jgi:hypothetical protein